MSSRHAVGETAKRNNFHSTRGSGRTTKLVTAYEGLDRQHNTPGTGGFFTLASLFSSTAAALAVFILPTIGILRPRRNSDHTYSHSYLWNLYWSLGAVPSIETRAARGCDFATRHFDASSECLYCKSWSRGTKIASERFVIARVYVANVSKTRHQAPADDKGRQTVKTLKSQRIASWHLRELRSLLSYR